MTPDTRTDTAARLEAEVKACVEENATLREELRVLRLTYCRFASRQARALAERIELDPMFLPPTPRSSRGYTRDDVWDARLADSGHHDISPWSPDWRATVKGADEAEEEGDE